MIEIVGLSFSYNGGPPVLKGIELSIESGEMVGILGPNGSGKSTLLKLISGTLDPGRGYVLLDGVDLSRMKRKIIAKKMAVVPQETDLGFDFTVREVVSMGRYPHLGRFQFNDPKSSRIVEEAMSTTGVLKMADKPISKLSGGEKQRVIIARALAQEPDILLLDEPTKNLDIRHSLDILNLVKKMNSERGLTVIAVLHDLDLAARYCNRTVLLKDGEIHSSGPVQNVLRPSTIKEVFDVSVRVEMGERMRLDIIE
jgi:iron complex transport system ATP-binding protein